MAERIISLIRSKNFKRTILFIFNILLIHDLLFETCFADENSGKFATYPNCNPTYILRRYAAFLAAQNYLQKIPEFDESTWDIRISDLRTKWRATYLLPDKLFDPSKGISFGYEFPILIIEKASCKIVSAGIFH
jgi:hypothetical protein